MITWDLLFSYWIFIWFLFYYSIVQLRQFGSLFEFIAKFMNPFVAFCIALFENIISLGFLINNNNNHVVIMKYILMIISVKIIPMYMLYFYPINIVWNLILFISVMSLYLTYMHYKKLDIVSIYKKTFQLIKEEKNETPFLKLVKQITDSLSNGFKYFFLYDDE
jgi:hypothetical protein